MSKTPNIYFFPKINCKFSIASRVSTFSWLCTASQPGLAVSPPQAGLSHLPGLARLSVATHQLSAEAGPSQRLGLARLTASGRPIRHAQNLIFFNLVNTPQRHCQSTRSSDGLRPAALLRPRARPMPGAGSEPMPAKRLEASTVRRRAPCHRRRRCRAAPRGARARRSQTKLRTQRRGLKLTSITSSGTLGLARRRAQCRARPPRCASAAKVLAARQTQRQLKTRQVSSRLPSCAHVLSWSRAGAGPWPASGACCPPCS